MYRLIIADDEESIRNGIAHSLPWREWGYEVCALCSDGQEVLEQLKLVHPDVVLSDIRMPGMDGVELMQRLSSAYPDVKIVILICGGGAKSPLWRTIMANVLDITLQLPQTEQGPGYGGAMLAAVACGEYATVADCAKALVKVKSETKPDPELVQKYNARYAAWKHFYPALKPLE